MQTVLLDADTLRSEDLDLNPHTCLPMSLTMYPLTT